MSPLSPASRFERSRTLVEHTVLTDIQIECNQEGRQMKAAAIGILAVVLVTMPVKAATLVCEGQLLIPCGPNPFALPRHGTCGAQPLQLSGIVVQITENRSPPCGSGFFSSCGKVNISNGVLISGQYDRWQGMSVDDESIVINRKDFDGYVVRGGINRVTGKINLGELGDGPTLDAFKFRGTCERRERLF